ncbi:MAG: MFS transporter, partial [Caulobacteraceae bacterium]|nr:MFS transporter [Caulobacteraceae bacterium]
AVALAVVVLPRFGSTGGFAALAGAAALGALPSLFTPNRFAPMPVPEGEGGAPSARGWAALAATLVFVSAAGAVGVYLQPLAHEAGLSAGVARTANWVSLVAQVAGGAAATALAGRVRYFTVFLVTSAAYLCVWALFDRAVPAWVFVAANAAAGLFGLFLGPFLVPMTIDADPTRRAAMQSGAAQLMGGALGPLLASLVVGERHVRGVLLLAAALTAAGLAGVAALRFSRPGGSGGASAS